MAYQNINQYNYKKLYLLNRSEIQDFCLASDERDYSWDTIYSTEIIGANDGNLLPFNFDLDSSATTEFYVLNYNDYNPYNNLISSNFYNKNDEDLSCFSSKTICDIGLTGTDNGLVENMSGETITVTQGLLDDSLKFERLYFDRRLKLHQVTGYTVVGESQFSGLDKTMLFNIVSKIDDKIGVYHELYGGFYQGFYKLHGYDYEIFPERVNKGWSVEMLLKPRLVDEFTPSSAETTLNLFYPKNKNTFFYFGTRAENKYYHHADGEPISGYTRVTSGLTCLETCACCDSGVTISKCIYVYPPESKSEPEDPDPCKETPKNCGWEKQVHSCSPTITTTTLQCSDCHPCNTCLPSCDSTSSVEYTCETNPLDDSMSNAISLKLCGDPKNPKIGVRLLVFTGQCETSGSCSTSGASYVTGYTVVDLCTDKGIYDDCLLQSQEFLNKERWFLVDAVWERYKNLEDCDLCWKGGLCLITKEEYYESLAGNSVSLVDESKCGSKDKILLSQLNQRWLDEKDFRMGRLKIYVNGRKLQTFENIEEIIPRSLYGEKEKQIGVPYNISWGGGTQGLHNHLVFSGCPTNLSGMTYQQDPELFPNNILSGTSLSALTTQILLEQNFAGTFDGGISQFRMYTKPLSSDEIKHNYKILKDKFNLFDYDCPNCCLENDVSVTLCDLDWQLICDVGYEVLSSNTLTINAFYSEGSLNAEYFLNSEYPVDTNLTINFSDVLERNSEPPYIIEVQLTLTANSSEASFIFSGDVEFSSFTQSVESTGITKSSNSFSKYYFSVEFVRNFIPTTLPFELGREWVEDKRDKNYLIENNFEQLSSHFSKSSVVINPIISTPKPSLDLTERYWNDEIWWGNQGNTPQCVGYAWSHWISDGPILHRGIQPNINPTLIYTEAQKIDEWPGENYAGTSVRAGAKFLKNTNKIKSYYWTFDLNTLVNTVINLCPVVVGTYWYYGMFFPDRNGIIRTTGRIVGGHAYVISGVDKKRQLFRIKNSWGRNWGIRGRAFISFADMNRLIMLNGEICLAIENNF